MPFLPPEFFPLPLALGGLTSSPPAPSVSSMGKFTSIGGSLLESGTTNIRNSSSSAILWHSTQWVLLTLGVEALILPVLLMIHIKEVPLAHVTQGQHVAIDCNCVVFLVAQDIVVFTVELKVPLFKPLNYLKYILADI